MNAVPWLVFAGTEIGNANRTLTYVQRFGDPRIEVHLCDGEVIVGGGYSDTYSDVYEADASSPARLCCYCEATAEAAYLSVAEDPAPWYDAARPESEEFLGLYPHTVELDPVHERELLPRAEGAVVTRLRSRQRIVAVEGLMFATTARGMYYGETWLEEVLRGLACPEDCPSDELCYLPTCPPEGDPDPDRYFRVLKSVGLVEGPEFSERVAPDCVAQTASFQLAAGRPQRFGMPVTCASLESVSPGNPVNCLVETTEWTGRATLQIEVEAQLTMTDVRISGKVSLDGSCPVTGVAADVMDCFEYVIPVLQHGDVLRIDGTRRVMAHVSAALKSERSALPLMTLDGPVTYPDVAPCTQLCVTVATGSGAGVVTVHKVDVEN